MKICTGVELRDVIMDVKFKFEKNFRDFCPPVTASGQSLGEKIRPFPLTVHVGLTTLQRYRADYDLLKLSTWS